VQDGFALCLKCSETCNIRIDREAATLPVDRICPHIAAASARMGSMRDHRGSLVALCVKCEGSFMRQIDGMWGDARPMNDRITRAIDGLLWRDRSNPSLPHPTTCEAAHDEKGVSKELLRRLSKGWGDSVLTNPHPSKTRLEEGVTVSLVGSLPSPKAWKFDPLDVLYDGISLRTLIKCDENSRREGSPHWCNGSQKMGTPAQRAAISAHWSAQLRAKIAEAAETERRRVLIDVDD
jgi:hypothetical protein